MRGSSSSPGRGGGAGLVASQLRSTRWAGSWASRCCSRVVPVRGSPMITIGAGSAPCRMAGVSAHACCEAQPVDEAGQHLAPGEVAAGGVRRASASSAPVSACRPGRCPASAEVVEPGAPAGGRASRSAGVEREHRRPEPLDERTDAVGRSEWQRSVGTIEVSDRTGDRGHGGGLPVCGWRIGPAARFLAVDGGGLRWIDRPVTAVGTGSEQRVLPAGAGGLVQSRTTSIRAIDRIIQV